MNDSLWHFALQFEDLNAGALLYEHVPKLGRAIAWLKWRMG
ncbi:hypothetical protein [Pseudomonas sp. IT-P253]|jgi:hypothetical protein